MSYTTTGSPFSSSFGATPRVLQLLIGLTTGFSIASGLFDRFFTGYLGTYSPHYLLGLSWPGLYDLFLWQPASYLFVHHGMGGLSLGFMIELLFHMYLLYFMGSAIIGHIGEKAFTALYFTSGIAAGLAGLATMSLTGQQTLILGAGPAIYGVLTVWSILYPEMELMLFFAVRVTARVLLLALLGIALLIDLSQGDLVGMTTYLIGAISGYLFAIIGWDLRGPFPQTHRMDALIASIGNGVRERRRQTQEMMSTVYHKAKVFDFETGEAILDDEDFMDAMLTKIAKYGKKSLSRQEKKRMERISQEKLKK